MFAQLTAAARYLDKDAVLRSRKSTHLHKTAHCGTLRSGCSLKAVDQPAAISIGTPKRQQRTPT